MGQTEHSGIRSETEDELRKEHRPMPFMETEVQRIHFAERKKEHKEDQPRQGGCQRQEQFIAKCSDEHREPEGVGIKEFSHCKKKNL